MSHDYCDDKACPACNVQRHFQVIKDAGCPDGELVEIVIYALANVVNDIEIHAVEMPDEVGVLH